jgi:formylglycine-generating enzyme required for sulfatase activity
VDWQAATAFAAWLSQKTGQRFRLPTEAEWEYAARAGTQTARFWGDAPDGACTYANVHDKTPSRQFKWTGHHDCDDGYAVTAPVGRFRPNPFGLYDMLGNALEWTCSVYDADYGGAEKDCANKGSSGRRVIRGGSWYN